jgi:DNA-binding NarL/FixJ family response regulator
VRLAERLRPDVVVMDVRMPLLNGLEATRQIKARQPQARVLILSAYEDDQYVFPLLEAGANGYLLKIASGKELAQAIHTVHRGEMVLAPHIASKVVSHLTGKQRAYRGPEMIEALTEREMEVLRALAGGKSNKEIAETLYLSVYTVQVHLRNIFAKLDVGSRTEAVTYAIKQGWVRLEAGS